MNPPHQTRRTTSEKNKKTLQRFIDEDNVDFDEAAESEVEKRKFLLNIVIDREILPENASCFI